LMRNPGEELEDAAARYASEAIRLDSQGNYAGAIVKYQNAVEALLKLIRLYPDNPVNRLYYEKAMAYQERIKALQRLRGIYGAPEGESSPARGDADGGIRVAPMVETVKATFEELLVTEKPNVSSKDVVGLDNAKLALRQAIVYPYQRPDLFPLGWPRGILLFGPPGCGKTMLAAAIANEIDGYFLSVDAASIMSKWLGDAEKNVAKLFAYARGLSESKPVIIFIDEVDSLLTVHRQEVGGETRVRNQFLKEMDGLSDKGKNLQLYVLAATNKPWMLDEPFLRRFQKRIYVQPPDEATRKLLFEKYTEPLVLDSNVNLGELAKLTEGYSASDIRDICQDAQLRVVTELFESGRASDPRSRPRPIKLEDFKEIIKQRKPSLIAERIKLYEKWNEMYSAA